MLHDGLDYSGIFAAGVCVICHQPRTIAGYDVHAESHLQRGEAVTDNRRVIPNVGAPAPRPVRVTRKLDPALRQIVRRKLADAQRKEKP